MPDFLLEIGCEEIPARMIDAASLDLRERVQKLLAQERLSATGTIFSLDSPRRLSVLAEGVPVAQPDVTDQVTGPSANVAFKDGQPTAAAHAFARKAGVDVSQLERVTTSKGEYLAAKITKKGRSTAEVLSELLPKEINSIYWPKNMYWRKPSEQFVRPVRWLVALLGSEVIPLEFDGVRAGNETRGHRILAEGPILISSAGSAYVEALRTAKVLGRGDRELQIRKELDAATRTIPGARWREDKTLLETVVNLTEFPSVVLGSFDRELRARFNDARFFWQTDQKHPLRERTAWLKNVTFQKDLGTYYEKTKRVQRLCSWLCEIIRHSGMQVRPGIVHKAASLAKTDLTAELVKEFTELQGIVGGLYASVQELDSGMPDATRQAIAQAIYDHYKPESTEDSVPRSVEGAVLSIADKADSIAGMFALGLQPTGSKDPFALRRQANGIVKTIAEKKLVLRLTELFADAREVYRGSAAERKFSGDVDYAAAVRTFFRERLEFYLSDVLGFKYDVVNAVLAAGSDDVVDVIARAEAVTKVRPSADFESISIAFKRIKNILRQASETRSRVAPAIDVDALQETVEKELAAQIPRTAEVVDALRIKRNYEPALIEISKLRPIVDRFFDKVMVMVDDERVRANRLALLQSLLKEFSTIADFSEIVTEGKESKESSKH